MKMIDHDKNMRTEILRRRYLWKDAQGNVTENPEQMFRRVANAIAEIESKYGATDKDVRAIADEFYELMANGTFLPNSPTLMNAGRGHEMLSACFVLPVEDSIDAIFDAVKYAALIQKAGGGTGFSFDRLRPTGDIVRSSGGKTSGPVSFMKVFSEGTCAIQQGAFRRGANMGMMSIDHPDILSFIHAKNDFTAFTNFNFSVKVPDTFMKQLKDNPDTPHVVTNPRTKRRYVVPRFIKISSYTMDDLLPESGVTDDCFTVQEVWDMIIRNAWATGEPGICFIDRVNEDNPTPHIGQIEATNPCGEQPLLPYEACNLGSIAISNFVQKDGCDLDWDSLANTVTLGIRFLDDVIDVNHYPIPQIERITLANRKIGLGIMGFADALIQLGIGYGSEDAAEFAERLASFVQERTHQVSEELAKERGCFPNWKGSVWDTKYHRPMRNAACTTIAPTGSISIIAECSSGIEPIFSFATKRRVLDGQEFIQLHPLIKRIGTKGNWLTNRDRDQFAQGIPLPESPEIPRELAEVLVTAHEVAPEWHVRIQAAFQKYTDNAVSKTVNLSADSTVEDIDKVYRLAFELGCKGITVYKDSSRENQVITVAHRPSPPDTSMLSPRLRPRKTTGQTIKSRTGCGTLFISVNKDENGLCEVFANLGKAGGCPSQSEATCRLVSAALRCGVDPGVLVEQLKKIRCLSTIARRKGNDDIDVLSCPDAIGRAIEEILGENCDPVRITLVNRCPYCGYPLRREAGCNVCYECGYSKCG
ncbi:MAG: vitamin B12-dependent ribonucleotide reductase [Planctomycetota bacterium]|jgi:ribonucleoside-diphosphate reductase alpha chain